MTGNLPALILARLLTLAGQRGGDYNLLNFGYRTVDAAALDASCIASMDRWG